MKNKYLGWFVIVIVIVINILLFSIVFFVNRTSESFESSDVLLVVSRYNENLEWLKEDEFQKHRVLIYNKGTHSDFYKPPEDLLEEIVSVKNVGREGHTYLYYIIQNYDKLNNITVFLPGSNDLSSKLEKSKRMMHEIEKHQKAVFISSKHENVKNDLYDFQIDNYVSSHPTNASTTKNDNLEPATIRPFGKWFEHHFGDLQIQHVTYGGIFSVMKEDILQHPKSYYENLIQELNNHPNPEVGHYFERSWEAVFFPMKNTVFLE